MGYTYAQTKWRDAVRQRYVEETGRDDFRDSAFLAWAAAKLGDRDLLPEPRHARVLTVNVVYGDDAGEKQGDASMFRPADLEILTAWSPDSLRVMRTKGILDLLGTQDANGRWRYSRKDAAAIWIASVMRDRDRLVSLELIFGQAYTVADDLLAHIDGQPAPRFAAQVYSRDPSGLRGWEAMRVDSLDAIDVPGLVSIEALDLAALARIAPDKLRERG